MRDHHYTQSAGFHSGKADCGIFGGIALPADKKQNPRQDGSFVLPGGFGDHCSAGCNELIRNGTAACISEVNSLLDSLGLRHGGKWEKDDIRMKTYTFYRDREGADPAERLSIVADIVGRNPDIRIEDIATAANMEYRDAANAVGMLECDGIVVTDLLRRCSVNPRFL